MMFVRITKLKGFIKSDPKGTNIYLHTYRNLDFDERSKKMQVDPKSNAYSIYVAENHRKTYSPAALRVHHCSIKTFPRL